MYKCDYTKLLVWSESLNLAKIMYQITSTSLFARDVGLKEQLRRSAVSIPSNIAEWHNRSSNKEFVRFLYYAKWSVAEIVTQLYIAKSQSYIDQESFDYLLWNYTRIISMIWKLIAIKKSWWLPSNP